MKRSGVIASLLLLAGCVGSSFSRPYDAYGDAPPDSLRGQCERTVYEDPKVKEALARSAGTAGADDIKALAVPVLAHRLIFSSDQLADLHDQSEQIVTGLLQEVPVPL